MTKVALYARYSDELQSPTSIDDQLRICRERAKREGWQVVGEYTDRAITGSVMGRSGLQQLLADARQNKFDVVIAEALDRLSRDQEGTAHIYKRLKFSRVRIVTLSENEIGVMDVGLRGTMNQLFLTELGRKTHRGLEGRVLAGKSAGGLSFGYAMVRNIDASGTLIRGERVINDEACAKSLDSRRANSIVCFQRLRRFYVVADIQGSADKPRLLQKLNAVGSMAFIDDLQQSAIGFPGRPDSHGYPDGGRPFFIDPRMICYRIPYRQAAFGSFYMRTNNLCIELLGNCCRSNEPETP